MGTVTDFLFDDASWRVRWLVVDCGTWLTRRKVLIHPSAISRADWERKTLSVTLTKAQVENSPHWLRTSRCRSRWRTSCTLTTVGIGLGAAPISVRRPSAIASPYLATLFRPGPERRRGARRGREFAGSDPHVRSVEEVTGYHIHAVDGEIGHVENFMVDDADWGIRYFIVDTRNWCLLAVWSG